MRILVLTNFYPPHSLGGMEISCRETVDGLIARGHSVQVLTSRHGVGRPLREGHVSRQLTLEMEFAPFRNAWRFFLLRKRHEAGNRAWLQKKIESFQPELIFIWGMWNLHRTLAQDAEERMQGRVLYRFADYWPSLPSQYRHFWLAPGRRKATRRVRRILAPLALRLLERDDPVELSFPHAYCVSEAVRSKLTREGIPASQASVIHTGLDLRPFEVKGKEDRRPPRASHTILYAGRLAPEKGVHILLEAISLLAHQDNPGPWKVTIAGGGEPGYVAELEEMVRKHGLLEEITFLGRVPAEAIPSLTQEHGIVVLPSLWEEPLPRMAIEGMASGCAVIASDVGGMSEIIVHERTGLLVPPGDPKSLAHALAKLATEPGLAQGMGEAGHASAHSRFRLDHMLDQVEELLGRIARPALYEVGTPVSSA